MLSITKLNVERNSGEDTGSSMGYVFLDLVRFAYRDQLSQV